MKSIVFAVCLLVTGGVFAGTLAYSGTPVILPVAGVYAPHTGYDDNDMIQLVVDGFLPNACWVVDKTEAKLMTTSNEIIIQQFVRKQETDICKDESALPPELKNPVNFMAEVSLGVLAQGHYTVVYSGAPDGKIQSKTFSVDKAPTTEIDNLYYAITTDLYVPKVVTSSAGEFTVSFSGYLSNPCSEIEQSVISVVQKDVIVLMPQVHKFVGTCLPVAQEFSRSINLKTPAPGRYLMQIRSANGNAVNRFFTVK